MPPLATFVRRMRHLARSFHRVSAQIWDRNLTRSVATSDSSPNHSQLFASGTMRRSWPRSWGSAPMTFGRYGSLSFVRHYLRRRGHQPPFRPRWLRLSRHGLGAALARRRTQAGVARRTSRHLPSKEPCTDKFLPIVIKACAFLDGLGYAPEPYSKRAPFLFASAIFRDFAVHLKLACSSPAVHCHPASNARECAVLLRRFRSNRLQPG